MAGRSASAPGARSRGGAAQCAWPALAVVALLQAACVLVPGAPDDDIVDCPDGSYCTDGQRCVSSGGCASQAAIDACEVYAPGARCAFDGLDGACIDSACRPGACPDGRQCPAGLECSVDGMWCVEDLLVESCNEKDDYQACLMPTPGAPPLLQTGRCWQGRCGVPTCGDACVDSEQGEACDDGNLEPGDGCDDTCLPEGEAFPAAAPGRSAG